jgi:hypothetical protein
VNATRQVVSTLSAVFMAILAAAGCGTPVVGIPGAPPQPPDSETITTLAPQPDGQATSMSTTASNAPSSKPKPGNDGTTTTPKPDDSDNFGGSLGSPIHIPIPSDNLCCNSYTFGKPRLEENIRKACGNNQLCVTVYMIIDGDPSNDSLEPCERVSHVDGYKYTEHSSVKYVEVARGGRVGVVVNVACRHTSSTSPSKPSPSR